MHRRSSDKPRSRKRRRQLRKQHLKQKTGLMRETLHLYIRRKKKTFTVSGVLNYTNQKKFG